MQRIKRFVLRVFLVLFIIGILAVLTVFSVSSSVKRSTSEDIACIVTGEVSFNQVTQQQLAEKSGVHQVNISRIENGTGNPSVETLQKLAKGMGKKLIIAFA